MAKDPDRIIYLSNRREVLIKGIGGALALMGTFSKTGTVFASVPGVAAGETPGLEEGPFWVDGMPERVDVRLDSTTGVYEAGLPVYLGLTVSQLSDTAPYTIKPLVGARVDIWNCNADGVYSAESSQDTSGTDFLRGHQITNSHGVVEFLTNYPGWYSGRTLHIHFRVRTYDESANVTYDLATQVFFDEAITAQVYSREPYVRARRGAQYLQRDGSSIQRRLLQRQPGDRRRRLHIVKARQRRQPRDGLISHRDRSVGHLG